MKKLFLITTEDGMFATTAHKFTEARIKFIDTYDDRKLIRTVEITPETLVRMEDNDSIVFF